MAMRQVVGQRHDPPDLHARRRHHLELRHHRAGGAARDGALHLEGPQRLEQHLAEPVELRLAGVDVPGRRLACSSSIGGSSDSTSGSGAGRERLRPWRGFGSRDFRSPGAADAASPSSSSSSAGGSGAVRLGARQRPRSSADSRLAASSRCSGCQATVTSVSAESARKPSRRAPANPTMSYAVEARNPGSQPVIRAPSARAGHVGTRSSGVTRLSTPTRYGATRLSPADQDGRALHVEPRQPVEAGQAESEAEERHAERADAEPLPEAAAERSRRAGR